jgi:CRISPR-associated protein Csd2
MTFEKRVEFVLLFDVIQGNPNGDPDAGNAPRVDPETGYGIVTDVCLKRKIRNFIAMTKEYQPPYDIYVKERGILAREQKKAYEAVKAEPLNRANEDARRWMCDNYKKKGAKKDLKRWNCGQVRGPVQIGFARSQSRILSLEHAITRVALTNPGDTGRDVETDTGEEKAGSGQMGRKHTIPYALYRAHGFISPFLAKDTGFSVEDYKVLLEALTYMFEHDRSAARAEMSVRGLAVFEHETALGNAPAHQLFDSLRIEGLESPRSFADYRVSAPETVPSGVGFHWEVAP